MSMIFNLRILSKLAMKVGTKRKLCRMSKDSLALELALVVAGITVYISDFNTEHQKGKFGI